MEIIKGIYIPYNLWSFLAPHVHTHSVCFAIVDAMLVCVISYNILIIGWYLHLGWITIIMFNVPWEQVSLSSLLYPYIYWTTEHNT